MDWLTAFLAEPAGMALKALLVAAALDFIFGVLAAWRDDSFALTAVAAWLRKHLAGRVGPIAVLLVTAHFTGDGVILTAAAAAGAAYTAETFGSIIDSIGTIRNPEPMETPVTLAPANSELGRAVASGSAELVIDAANPVPTD